MFLVASIAIILLGFTALLLLQPELMRSMTITPEEALLQVEKEINHPTSCNQELQAARSLKSGERLLIIASDNLPKVIDFQLVNRVNNKVLGKITYRPDYKCHGVWFTPDK
jgi:hypothetical protein